MRFPAVWVANEATFGVTDTPMVSGTTVAYRNGFWNGLRFFDTDGQEWRVVEATPDRAPSVIDRLLNRAIRMSLRFAGPRACPVQEVAEILCGCLDQAVGDLYTQALTRDELKAYFRTAPSLSELMQRVRTLGEDIVEEEPA